MHVFERSEPSFRDSCSQRTLCGRRLHFILVESRLNFIRVAGKKFSLPGNPVTVYIKPSIGKLGVSVKSRPFSGSGYYQLSPRDFVSPCSYPTERKSLKGYHTT